MTAALSFLERPLVFACDGEQLLGILAEPAQMRGVRDLGFVIVVGGPQYRAGSHRQFVQLARAVAASGVPSLRFDVRGMGDSTGEFLGFEAIGQDIESAIMSLQRAMPNVKRVVLMGLCDGASAALLYVARSPGGPVSALCLLNPWVRSEQSLAQVQIKHYYKARLFDRSLWLKVARGQVGVAAGRDFLLSLFRRIFAKRGASATEQADFRTQMLKGAIQFQGHTLTLLSTNDLTAREFEELVNSSVEWRAALLRRGTIVFLEGADHTLSSSKARLDLEGRIVEWLSKISADSVVA